MDRTGGLRQAVVSEKEAYITELKALIEKLEDQVQDYRRTKFGPKSDVNKHRSLT